MAQATRTLNQTVNDADRLWADFGVVGADEMLHHVRSDNQALATLRLALEHDMACERLMAMDGAK